MATLRADLTYEAQQALYQQSEQHSREREKLQRESDVRAADVGRHYAASSADQQNALNYRVQQLELTLRSQEQHHAQVLAQKEQERVAILARACAPNPSSQHNTPESADYMDVASNAGSMKTDRGFISSLVSAGVQSITNKFGNTNTCPSTTNTHYASTNGVGGSEVSTYAFPVDLTHVTPTAVNTGNQLSGTQTYTAPYCHSTRRRQLGATARWVAQPSLALQPNTLRSTT
jgi:hypothetical protein